MPTALRCHYQLHPETLPRHRRSIRSRARPPSPEEAKTFDMSKEQCPGVVLGIAMSDFRTKDGEEHFRVVPGDDVKLSFPTAGTPPKVTNGDFHGRRFLREQDERIRQPSSSSCPSRSCKNYAA